MRFTSMTRNAELNCFCFFFPFQTSIRKNVGFPVVSQSGFVDISGGHVLEEVVSLRGTENLVPSVLRMSNSFAHLYLQSFLSFCLFFFNNQSECRLYALGRISELPFVVFRSVERLSHSHFKMEPNVRKHAVRTTCADADTRISRAASRNVQVRPHLPPCKAQLYDGGRTQSPSKAEKKRNGYDNLYT